MNQVLRSEKSKVSGRSYSLPFETHFGNEISVQNPPEPSEWSTLHDRFMDGLTFASQFTGSSKAWGHHKLYVEFVHVLKGKAYATDNVTLVEYDVGPAPKIILDKRQIAIIKAIGAPLQAGLKERACESPFLCFRSANGNQLTIEQMFHVPLPDAKGLLDQYDWSDFHEVDPSWRAQVVGHFSFKSMRDSDGYLHVRPGQIASGIFDHRLDTFLEIDTYCDMPVLFNKDDFLKVLKTADAFKFVYEDEFCRLLFVAQNVRGVLTSLDQRGELDS